MCELGMKPRECEGTPASPAAPQGHGERLLIVDDEKAVLKVVEKGMGRKGYAVISYTQPGEALDRFREDPTGIALVITDHSMPEMSGTDLAKELLAIRRDVPIVLTTGLTDDERMTEAKELGIMRVVSKPVRLMELAAVVHELLAAAGAERAHVTGPV